MKTTLEELRGVVTEVIAEAKSKKKKKDETEECCNPFDFSAPLGDLNLYKTQGASNMGPWTNEVPVPKELEESIRAISRSMIAEQLSAGGSVWDLVESAMEAKSSAPSIWESALNKIERK